MATAIEYGLIAAGISIAIIAAVGGIEDSPQMKRLGDDKKTATVACAAPHDGETVIIKDWLGYKVMYKCSYWPFSPTYVRHL